MNFLYALFMGLFHRIRGAGKILGVRASYFMAPLVALASFYALPLITPFSVHLPWIGWTIPVPSWAPQFLCGALYLPANWGWGRYLDMDRRDYNWNRPEKRKWHEKIIEAVAKPLGGSDKACFAIGHTLFILPLLFAQAFLYGIWWLPLLAPVFGAAMMTAYVLSLRFQEYRTGLSGTALPDYLHIAEPVAGTLCWGPLVLAIGSAVNG